jgi:hypothetical protein
MAKNFGRLFLMLLLPPFFYTGKAVQSKKALAEIYQATSSSQTSYYLAGSLCCRFFI